MSEHATMELIDISLQNSKVVRSNIGRISIDSVMIQALLNTETILMVLKERFGE